MHRRHVLRALGTTAVLPLLGGLSAEEALALGNRLHTLLPPNPVSRRVLDAHQDATLTAIAERIIPATETPGATDARVSEFIDLLLAEWAEPAARDVLLTGLGGVDARAGRPFTELDAAAQDAILAQLEAESPPASPDAMPSFFRMVKQLTLFGYYTSEAAAAELHYEMIPGAFRGCEPWDDVH